MLGVCGSWYSCHRPGGGRAGLTPWAQEEDWWGLVGHVRAELGREAEVLGKWGKPTRPHLYISSSLGSPTCLLCGDSNLSSFGEKHLSDGEGFFPTLLKVLPVEQD